MKGKLTPKQQKFIDEYLVDNNASRSALAAGYSPRTAPFIGAENLRKPQIAAAINRAIALQAERTEITADKVLKEYAKIAFADAQTYHTANGSVRKITDLSKDDSAAIRDFEQAEDGSVKIKLHDKLKSLDSLAKHLGLLQPDSADMGKVPSLKIFVRADDGEIRELQDSGRLKEAEPVPGVCIDVVDAREYPDENGQEG